MAKTKQQKEQEVSDLSDRLQEAKGVVFSSYQGLTVGQTEDLRKKLRAEGSELKMAKKNLLRLVLDQQKLDKSIVDNFSGSVSVAFGFEDEVTPARIVADFAKTNEQVEIFGGILENTFIDAAKVKALAQLPSREQLLAKLVGSINAPVNGLVQVLAGNLRALVYALNAIKTTKN